MSDLENLDELRDAYLECRTYGHAWYEIQSERPLESNTWWLTLRCKRCKTLREAPVSALTGDTDGNRYKYPDGYRLDEKVTRSQFRQTLARRRDYDFITANRSKRKKGQEDDYRS